MTYFYREGELGFESGGRFFSLQDIARRAARPVYVYNLDEVIRRYRLFSAAFDHRAVICYALKANSQPLLLKSLADLGAGADVVSAGEIKQALAAGFSPHKIVFSGVAKEKYEIQLALKSRIRQINVESPAELRRIGQLAREMGCQAPVAFRLNPDVNPETHPYIRTGFRENKFGMDASFLFELEAILKEFSKELKLVGLTLHIGSQIRDIGPLTEAVRKSLPWYDRLGRGSFHLQCFDIGGGLGIDYHNAEESPELRISQDYAFEMRKLLDPLNCEILCEPGRIIVARSGVLLSEVQYIKETPYKRFAMINTGMHHLLRPSLYEAYHRILPLVETSDQRDLDRGM
ncbi:MAG: diaminopimelate decarboxylase, partial [Bdellovibrionales bacterium]|nr:diaminopimelate decarboxylase [Bdellovibrionales bacterium]